jgi:hypothetical protein
MGGLPRHSPSPAQAQPRGIPMGSGLGTSAARNLIRIINYFLGKSVSIWPFYRTY